MNLDNLESKLCEKIMVMKSYFMDELHSVTNNSSTTSDSLSTNPRSTNNNVDKNSVTSLNKTRLLEPENKLLKGYLCNESIFCYKVALDV